MSTDRALIADLHAARISGGDLTEIVDKLTSVSQRRFERVRDAVLTAQAQAIAYVWGRQDMGEAGDTERSMAFGAAYGAHVRAYEEERHYHKRNIRDAYERWAATGHIEEA